LSPSEQATVNAVVRATAIALLGSIGPHNSPAQNAALINRYREWITLLNATSWLTRAQAATLTADAQKLA